MRAGTKNDAIQTRSSTAASTVNAVGNENFLDGSAVGGVGGGGGSVASSGTEGARSVEEPIESGMRRSSPRAATGGIIRRGRLRSGASERSSNAEHAIDHIGRCVTRVSRATIGVGMTVARARGTTTAMAPPYALSRRRRALIWAL